MGDEETNLRFDFFRFRRKSSRNNTLVDAISTIPNIYHETDKAKHQKTYTILQETGADFNLGSSNLRTILLFYSNSGWKFIMLGILFIEFILDTCVYTFFGKNERPFGTIVLIICFNFVFTFDVAILVGLKISKKWRKTLNLVEPDTIIVILDVILAIPFSFFYLINDQSISFNIHVISPLMATIRAYRIVEYFYNRSSEAGSNQWTSFLSQYLILFLLSVHTWTCLLYLFSNRSYDIQKIRSSWSYEAIYLPTESTMDWYYVCTYLSVMFLTTNALGDLHPVTATERIIAISAILVGFLLTTVVFVGSLTSQFITITTRRSVYVRRLKKIQNHLSLINMDTDTTNRIIRYYEDLWYQKSGVFKPKLIRLLPCPLQMEICYDLNAVPLFSSLIFRKLPEAFLRRLSLDMSHQFYLPGDVVYKHNQNKTSMVCITNGVLELLSDEDDESPMISFAKGTCFGEISMVYNIPARCTVKAATYVECQVLEKTQFIKLMVTYPDLVDKIRQEIQDRINRSIKGKQTERYNTQLSLSVYASKDRMKSSIRCLKDKLKYLQGKTESDNLTKDDHLDENCLDLYIISEHVKKKISDFTCINSNFLWILEAECYLVKFWDLYMLMLVLYICLVYPYQIGMNRKFSYGILFYTEVLITISLVFNIMMTSVTAVKTKKLYIKDIKGILRYRLNTLGFFLDLVSMVPFEYIVDIHTTVKYHDEYTNHLFYLCKGIKLCLVWRLSLFFQNMDKKLLLNTLFIKIVKYGVFMCLLCYWCGVGLYMEACFASRCSENSWFSRALIEDDQKYGVNLNEKKSKYPIITSVYFATTIIMSVGYGDYTPGDKFDMAFVAFLSVYGVLLSGYCISEFSAVVTHWSRTTTAFLEIIITIDKFMKENSMHQCIKRRIMAFYELQWQYNWGVEVTDENWLEKTPIPSELRKKVLHQARFRALTSITFFQVKNKAYIHTLTETAQDIILPPGEIVYYGGTVTRELYIIESGYCLVTSNVLKEKNKEKVIGPGNHLGLLVLLYGVPAINTVVTLTHCKLISISHSAYTSALSLFPDMIEHEGLMQPEELEQIEKEASGLNTETDLKYDHLGANKKVKITSILHTFFDDSFINVSREYKKRKQSYWKSYKQFNGLNNIAPYLLLPIVIRPDGLFLKFWALLRVIVAYLICIFVPIVVATAPASKTFNGTVLFLEGICYVDLYLMLHVAYYGPKNIMIYHPYMTARYYLTGRFVIDVLICFPWYALWMLFMPKHNEGHTQEDHYLNVHMYHCVIKMVHILQICKVKTMFSADSIRALKRAYLMSVFHFFLLTIFFLNLYTSILITITCKYVIATDPNDFTHQVSQLDSLGSMMNATFHPDGTMICRRGSWIDGTDIFRNQHLSVQKVYLLALYWVAASFSSAGIGDIIAQDTMHMILTICVNVHGVFFFGYVYARISSLKAMADQVVTNFQEDVKHLDMFLKRERVPIELKKSVMEYWNYQWKRTGGWSHQAILGKLHANLNEDAVLYMYEKTLREIPLFENVEYSFFRAFAKNLRETYFQKGYMVMRKNEVISTMYIIFRGKVAIISVDNNTEACMGPGGIFGNIRGANKYLTMSNVSASRNLDVLSIEGREFYMLLNSFPSVLKKVQQSVNSTEKDYVIPTMTSMTNSLEIAPVPLTYESGDDEDDTEINQSVNLESPDKSINESHGSKSVASFGVHYIPASLLLLKPHRWFRSSILPDSRLVTFMDYFILFLSYMDFNLLVYQMAFHSIPYFFYICLTSDFIYMLKIFIDIHSGYINKYGDYVLNPHKVRKMYLSKVLLRRRDFLANFPISYIAFALRLKPDMQMLLFCYLRSTQLVRVTYLFTFKTHRKTKIGSTNLIVKLTSIAIWASLLTHVNACLFFKLSCLTPLHCISDNWMTKPDLNLRIQYAQGNYFTIYIAAAWYMINLLTITGTGDVSSQNGFEVIETIFVIIVIKFCTGLLISEMSAMISAHASSRISYDYGINKLRDGLRDMDLSDHQMNKMWDYVRQLWNRQQGRQMPKLTHKLPFSLRCQVMEALYGSHIRESVIFSKTDEDFRRMLAMWMKHCVFFAGNYIVQNGDSDQCIYFIHRGQVEVLTVHPNLTESIYDVLGPEDSFGIAQGLFVGVSHHFSFRARTVVDIVYLKLDYWKYLLDYYPKAARIVKRKVENLYLAI